VLANGFINIRLFKTHFNKISDKARESGHKSRSNARARLLIKISRLTIGLCATIAGAVRALRAGPRTHRFDRSPARSEHLATFNLVDIASIRFANGGASRGKPCRWGCRSWQDSQQSAWPAAGRHTHRAWPAGLGRG